MSTRRYSSNTTAEPVGLDASPGGWKWARSDATPSVRRCYQAGAHGYSRVLRWYAGGWKLARSDATPSVRRCYQVGAHGYSRVHELVRRRVEVGANRRSAEGALHATSRAYTLQHAERG